MAVSGTLYYVPYSEFQRLAALAIHAIDRTAIFATLCRINALYMIARAGSGHIGSSFSSMDIMSWLRCNELQVGVPGDPTAPADIFFSSKGHDAPALYSTLMAVGKLDFELIHRLRRLDGLPGHPDVATPHVVANTGSLGMGVSKAKGMIFAKRLLKHSGRVFVLTGDGELQEGQFWESLLSAANHRMHELVVIVDHNKLQSDTYVSKVSDLGDLEAKLGAFGWWVGRCDGNSMRALSAVLDQSRSIVDAPKAIIADTIKGKGVSFMEHTALDSDVELYKFHSGAPGEAAYVMAAQELIDSANAQLAAAGAEALALESINRPAVAAVAGSPQRLIAAYSEALTAQARRNARIVALDADLVLDTGLIAFQKEFPDRFVECGIAEQDMVSQAGGMALQGLLPIVHSFACFLSARPNEQIYNNATEGKKIIYVGSLAGVVPGGPGHSHQAVRDISALSGVPGLVCMEPSCEAEVGMLLDWAINVHESSSYLRLISLPWTLSFSVPASYRPELGKGVALTEGVDAAIIGYGPVVLSAAVDAARMLRDERGLAVKVINLPWLNCIDEPWLRSELRGIATVISIDNHYRIGGQGDRLADVLARDATSRLWRIGVTKIPVCGTNAEVLAEHDLDSRAIAALVHSVLNP